MFTATITVTLRPSILDPEGKAIEHALHSLALEHLAHVRVGKHIVLTVATDDRDEATRMVDEACRKLLANPVMEDYTFTLEASH
jgi:phosphoribosylformylglycinamidine synthase subunit PurS